MSHNIVIPGGQSRRLPTAGKYCDQDIVVTAEAGGTVLPELSNPGGSEDLMAGKELIGPDGKVVPGSFTLDAEIAQQDALIEQIKAAMQGATAGGVSEDLTAVLDEQAAAIAELKALLGSKASGGDPADPVIEALEITENGVYNAPEGVDGYAPITVNVPVPEGYVKPAGELEITENGTHDVAAYASVNVNVEANGGGSDDMAGALADRTITEFSSNSCTAIGAYSFRDCEKLTTLVAPNAKSVGTYALYGCSKLKSIVLPSVTAVETNAFREVSNLEVIDLPKLTAIPANAFYGCRGLKTLILRSETVVTLANTNAFYQCYRILGTKNSGYNPDGEKIGFFYVPKALIEEYQAATNWSSEGLVTQFRAIEDYPEICGGGNA